MILYKVLNQDMTSPIQKFQFEIGKEYICPDFDENPVLDCSRGFYATDIDGLPYAYNVRKDVWRCEVSGRKVEFNQFKRRYEKFKLIEKIEKKELQNLAMKVENKCGYKLSEVLFPINPLLIERNDDVSEKEIALLENWASVGSSIGYSVGSSVRSFIGSSIGSSVGVSVGSSVGASVETSVGAPVGAPVGALIWAYIGSLFTNIPAWNNEYPFQSAVDLWRAGLVPFRDAKGWNLHANKKTVFTLKEEEEER